MREVISLCIATVLLCAACATVADSHPAPRQLRIVVGTNMKFDDIRRRVEFEKTLRQLVSETLQGVKVTNDPTAPYLSVFVHVYEHDIERTCSEHAYVVEAAYTERVRIQRAGRDHIQHATLWHAIAPGAAPGDELTNNIHRDVRWLAGQFAAGPVDRHIERPEYTGPPPLPPT